MDTGLVYMKTYRLSYIAPHIAPLIAPLIVGLTLISFEPPSSSSSPSRLMKPSVQVLN
jgi:hypothetical protein